MSMPVITLSPPSKTAISYPPEITKPIREASFSSYLNGAEESFVLKLGGSTTPRDHIFPGKNRIEDKEIDVFDAEKYFNEVVVTHNSPKLSPKNLYKKDDSPEILAIKEVPTITAPSIHSESSWNSRNALLHNVPRNQQVKKANRKRFLASIGCNCSCADKNSIDIDESIGENSSIKSIHTKPNSDKTIDQLVKKSQPDNYRPELNNISFPVTKNQAAKLHFQEKTDTVSSQVLENSKKLTLMTWDAIAPGEPKIPSISKEMLDDSDSDASSDLFEIESLSKGNPFHSRQASDGLSACYAPSEVSIEWSVVTASAADFSVLSDSEELTNTSTTKPCLKKVGLNSKTGPKLRPSILSGCKSQKAVRVAGDAHIPKESHARRQVRVGSFTRFHDEGKLAGFEVKNKFEQRVSSQTRPASAAHLLYT